MLTIPPGVKIFISSKPLDMRKSLDGMSAVVTKELKKDVFSGQLFVFCNKRGDKVKIFYWDRNGYYCWYKRLERGVFRLPRVTGFQEFTYISGSRADKQWDIVIGIPKFDSRVGDRVGHYNFSQHFQYSLCLASCSKASVVTNHGSQDSNINANVSA